MNSAGCSASQRGLPFDEFDDRVTAKEHKKRISSLVGRTNRATGATRASTHADSDTTFA